MPAVHQFVATLEPGAIGLDAVSIRQVLRDAGYESEIFTEHCRSGYGEPAYLHTDYGSKVSASRDDVLIYHMAIGSVVADFLMQLPQRLILRYHNITPVEYYEPWDPGSTFGMRWGRDQLRKMVTRTTLAAGVSEYNRRELEALHYARTAVTPVFIDFDAFDHAIDQAAEQGMLAERAEGGTDILFVGWVAPHKCQHDLIKAFALYRKLYDPKARLHLAGRTGVESYEAACKAMVSELGMEDCVRFLGRVSDGELGVLYGNCDVLVSMSEHEGVGLPLLEAMHHRLPVVAYAAAAVPETVGDCGLVLGRKVPALVAAGIDRVVSDQALRKSLMQGAAERVERFGLGAARAALLSSVVSLFG